MAILVTGGIGYIGTLTSVALLNADFDVVALDNFLTEAIHRVQKSTAKPVRLVSGDV